MLYRVYVCNWFNLRAVEKFLPGLEFRRVGYDKYHDPIFDCGVWGHADVFADARLTQWYDIELIRVWEA